MTDFAAGASSGGRGVPGSALKATLGTIVAGNHTKKGHANVILYRQLKAVASLSVRR